MNRHVLYRITALFLPAVLAAAVPDGEQAGPYLSLHTAIQRTLEKDIRLLPGKTALAIARQRQTAPSVWRDPEARFDTGLDNETDGDYLSPALRFFPPHPWQIRAASEALTAQTASAAAEYEAARSAAAAETVLLYRELQCLEQEISLAERLAAIKKELAEWTAQRAASGVETSAKSLLCRSALNEAERERRVLVRQYDALKGQLAARIDLAPEYLQLPPLDNTAFAPADPDEALRSALAHRPELALLQAQMQETEAALHQARAEQIPWFSHVQTTYSDRQNEWELEVAVSLPVFSAGGSKKRQALAEHSLQKTAVIFSEDAVALEVREALGKFTRALDEWTAHRAEQTALTEALQAEIKKIQDFAPAEAGDRLDLEEQMVRSGQDLLETLRLLCSAQADLFAVTGQLSLIPE